MGFLLRLQAGVAFLEEDLIMCKLLRINLQRRVP